MRLFDIPKDPLSLIAKQFEDPFDINAFENSHPKFKDSVEIYHIYREWERKLMPNDHIRIIATYLYLKVPKIKFTKGKEHIVLEKGYHDNFIINDYKSESYTFAKMFKKTPFLKLKLFPFKNHYAAYIGSSQYGFIIFIYNLLLDGFEHDYKYVRSIATFVNDQKEWYPNDKYRILSTFILATDYEPTFIKNGETVKLKGYKKDIRTAYDLFTEGYIYDNGQRTLQTRISDLTVF